MSLEQLMALASRMAQTPNALGAAARPDMRPVGSAALTSEELAALREIWSTPLEPAPAEPTPALLH